MTWSFDITTAPRDGSHVILAMPNGTTLRSYWCKPTHEPEHWCMLSHKNEPLAWMPWPEHPNQIAAATQGEAAATAPTNVSLPADERSGEGANGGGDHVTDHENAHPTTAGALVSAAPAFILDDCGSGA